MQNLAQIKLLISLASIDGDIAEKERSYILNIAHANQIKPSEVMALFTIKHELIVPQGLDDNQKFNYIFSLVQLMKIDERLYQDEIRFCSGVAAKLGYDQRVMFDLMLHVSTAMAEAEVKALQELTKKYLGKS